MRSAPLLLCLSLVLSLAVAADPASEVDVPEDGPEIPLHGRLLVDILADYQSAGYVFVYSAELVRRDLRLGRESSERDPIARLRASLEHYELTLRAGLEDRVYRIVRREGVLAPLQGRVSDAATGEPLPGARVALGHWEVTADSEGRFSLASGEAGPLAVSMEGYESATIPTVAPGSFAGVELERVREVEVEVVMVRDRGERAFAGRERVDHQVVAVHELATPALGGDPLRATSRLLGMSTNGLSASPRVRGGTRDETLVLFSGVRLLEPFHLRDFQSVFSGVAPHAIKAVDVYTGGFPARYGDSLSGVVDIEPADPGSGHRAELAWSILSASAAARGKIAGDRGAWAASVRRGNLNNVARNINPEVGSPSYDDGYGLLRWEFGPETRLELGTISYNDDIEFNKDDEAARSRYRNAYGWARLQRQWSPRLSTSTTLSKATIRHGREGSLIGGGAWDGGHGTLQDRRQFRVARVGQRATFRAGDFAADLGVGFERQRGQYRYRAVGRRGALAELVGESQVIQREVGLRPRLSRGDGYGAVRYRPWPALSLEAGLRWDRQEYGDHGGTTQRFTPRLSAVFDLGHATVLRVAMGTFSQAEGIHQLAVGDGVTRFQEPQRAHHFVAGIGQTFGASGLEVHFEAFHKRYSKTTTRFANLFNPIVLLPELAADRIAISPDRARVRGFEVTLRYRLDERLHSWLGYTRSSAEDRVRERWVPRHWDQTHSVSAGFAWAHGPWEASAALLWHSGWRTTDIWRLLRDPPDARAHFNLDRLPDFASLDMRLARGWRWRGQSLTAFLQLTNVLGRENLGGFEHRVRESETADVLEVRSRGQTMLPLVPSVGVRWQLH